MTSPTIRINAPQPATRRRGLSLPAWLVLICVIMFTVLLGAGAASWKNAPPVPAAVASSYK